MIKVYNGFGATKIGASVILNRFKKYGYDASFINEDDIKNNNALADPALQLIVFGGQSVTQFKQALGEEGSQAIQSYVQQGGKYLGICAGGYFGAEDIDFEGQDFFTKHTYQKQTKGLGFFNGLARGSLLEILPWRYTGATDSAKVINLKDETGKAFRSLYWGGGAFIPQESSPDLTPIAFYQAEDGNEITIGVQCSVGDKGGQATLLGYHPEISTFDLSQWLTTGHSAEYTGGTYADKVIAGSQDIDAPKESINLAFGMLIDKLNLQKPKTEKPQFKTTKALFSNLTP